MLGEASFRRVKQTNNYIISVGDFLIWMAVLKEKSYKSGNNIINEQNL